jgi:O-antigen/teichoic acid export membrane protein
VRLPPLVLNSVFNFFGRGLTLLLTLVSTRVLFHRLGSDDFGIYILANSIVLLLGVFDLGLSPAVIRQLSAAWHTQVQRDVEDVLTTAFTLFAGLGLIAAIALAAAVPWLTTGLLHVTGKEVGPAENALWVSAAGLGLALWASPFKAIPYALERFDLVAAGNLGTSIATAVAIIVYALAGGGLVGLVALNVAGAALTVVVFAVIGRLLLEGVSFRPRLHRIVLRALARFSFFKSAGLIATQLAFRFDRFAIGAIINVGAAGIYSIPANAAFTSLNLMIELVYPLYPRFSKLGADIEAKRLYLAGVRALWLLAAPALLLAFVDADAILRVWIGGTQGALVANQATVATRWLLVAFLLQVLGAVPSMYCEARGRPEINNGFSVASAILHVPLVLILLHPLGIAGASVALVITSLCVTVPFIVYTTNRVLGLSAVRLLTDAVSRPLIAALVTVAIAVGVRMVVGNDLAVVLLAVPLGLVYLVLAVLVGAIKSGELRSVWDLSVRVLRPSAARG